MFWRWLSKRVWLFGLILIAGLGIAFYLILAMGAKSSATQQLLRRQQTIARAEASNIASFFQTFGESVAVLAQVSDIKSRNAQTLEDMSVFVEQWRSSGLVGGVTLTDTRGVVLLNANVLGTNDSGVSLGDRDYFAWAKSGPDESDFFIGRPVVSRLGASKGQVIVPVAAAVYQNGVFVGATVASVKLAPLTKHYLELMRVSGTTDVYLVDQNGELLYSSSSPAAVGSNIFATLPRLKNGFDTTKEGKLQASGQLIAYSPVALGNQKWSLIMVSPDQDVASLAMPFYIREIVMLVLVSLTILLFGLFTAHETRKSLAKSKP